MQFGKTPLAVSFTMQFGCCTIDTVAVDMAAATSGRSNGVIFEAPCHPRQVRPAQTASNLLLNLNWAEGRLAVGQPGHHAHRRVHRRVHKRVLLSTRGAVPRWMRSRSTVGEGWWRGVVRGDRGGRGVDAEGLLMRDLFRSCVPMTCMILFLAQ